MSDLISRKALLDFLEDVPFLIEHQNLKEIVIEWVKQQPTAYDPDKVVEQLEEYGSIVMSYRDDMSKDEIAQRALNSAKKQAIDIVKKGGMRE